MGWRVWSVKERHGIVVQILVFTIDIYLYYTCTSNWEGSVFADVTSNLYEMHVEYRILSNVGCSINVAHKRILVSRCYVILGKKPAETSRGP